MGTGLAYSIGQQVIIANSSTDQMIGTITNYNSGTGSISVNVTSITGGPGPFTSWQINLNGAPGPAGLLGSTGATGSNGTNGATGTTGPNGLIGTTGTIGSTGVNGINGSTGATGAAGGNGTNGSTGSTGAAGANGINGAAGSTGAAGTNGTNGTNGSTGATGTNGVNGSIGITGNTGAIGTTGSTGASGLLQNGTTAGNTPYWDGSSWITNSSNIYNNGGNIGIGTASPNAAAKLHVELGGSTSSGILITGTFNGASTTPVIGSGSRMMFYPGKAVFRAGYVGGTQWDNDNTGTYSTAMGYNTIAIGPASTSMGSTNTASGYASTAMGESNHASGSVSASIGSSNTASGYGSTAMGVGNTASGDYSTAMGNLTQAGGIISTSIGFATNAGGDHSTAIGSSVAAPSYTETVIGQYNTTYFPMSTSAWNTADRLFVVANGASSAARSNAMTILKDGTISFSGLSSNGIVRAAGGTGTLSSSGGGINLTSEVTGVLPIANGGTNNGSLGVTNGGIIYSDGTKLMNAGAGAIGQMLTGGGAGAPVWANTAVRWDQITNPSFYTTIDHGSNTTAFTFNSVTSATAFALSSSSLTSGKLLDLSSNSTAGAAGGAYLLNISSSGANANGFHTAYGLNSSVTNTGASSTNYGGYFAASGAVSNNAVYAVTSGTGIDHAVSAINNSTGTNEYGVLARKTGNTGTGSGYSVYGAASGTGNVNNGGYFSAADAVTNYAVNAGASGTGSGYGVYASNTSTGAGDQYGVAGETFGSSGTTGYAISGKAIGAATLNYGGYFTASGAVGNYAVYAATSGTANDHGVMAVNSSTGTGSQYGVLGQTNGSTGGAGTGYGIYGTASGAGYVNDGGYFSASGATNNKAVEAVTIGNGNNDMGILGANASTGTGNQIGVMAQKNGNTLTGMGYAVYANASGTGTANYGGYFNASGASNNYAAVFDQGNVGIGTISPAHKLQVSTATSTFGVSHTDGTIDLSTYIGGAINGGYLGTITNHPLGFYTNNSGAQMYIQNGSGNVGIATIAPAAKLQIGNKVVDDNSYSYDNNSLMIVHQTPTASATLNDPKTVLMLARQGTASQAYGAAAAFNLSRYQNSGTNSRTRLDISLANTTFDAGSTVMTLLSSGNVGINSTSPTSKLQVVGLLVFANNAAAIAGGLTVGAFYRTGGDPDVVCVVH